jgi:hypothetical protein
VLVLQLVLCLGWLAAGLAQTAICSNTCSATADLQSKGSGQLEVSCTPGSLQQVPGLVLHPLLLNLSGKAHCQRGGGRLLPPIFMAATA